MKRVITMTIVVDTTRPRLEDLTRLAIRDATEHVASAVMRVPLTTGKGVVSGALGQASYSWSTKHD
jgi:hypothetical protein